MASIRLFDVGRDNDLSRHGVSHTRVDVFTRRLDDGRDLLRDGGQRGANRDERRATEGWLVAPWLRSSSAGLSAELVGRYALVLFLHLEALYVETHH